MNLKTTKQLPLLITFALLTACSTQNTSVTGSQSGLLGGQQSASGGQSGGLLGGQQSASGSQSGGGMLGGQQSTPGSQNSAGRQSIPGSQLIGQQNKNKVCVDKNTGKLIPGCKVAAKPTSTKKVSKLPSKATSSSKMRKIVLKAPKKTIASKTVAKPIMAKPFKPLPYTSSATSRTVQPIRPNSTVGNASSKRTTTMTRRPPAAFKPLRPAIRRPAPATLRRPAPVRRQPVVTQPYKARIIANPVRSAKPPVQPARPVVRPVVRKPVAAPVKKPQSTTRRLTLNGSANFKSGSSRLTPKGQTNLLVMSLSLQEGNTQVSRLLVEGHTDSVGNAAMNQVLSLKRANAVAEYLAKKGGFKRSMMETVGLGESKPVASNKTRKGRSLNRRVEITATGTRQIKR